MEAYMRQPEVLVLIMVLVVESVKALMLGTFTAYQRGKSGKFINAEDANWLGGEAVVYDAPGPGRWFRAQRNTLENLLPFSILACLFVGVGGNGLAGACYFLAFFLGRAMHSYAYLTCKPLLRRNAYSFAWLIQIIMALHVLVVVLGGLVYGL